MASVIRKTLTGLYCFRLRNQIELDAVLEEVSAPANKKVLLDMYDLATKEPYSFLFRNFMEKDINKTFMVKSNCYLTLK